MFRPHRDVRFSQDKSPYKTAQGAFASYQEGVGFYLQISADGLLVGGGYHSHSPAQLVRYRNSVDAAGTGGQLQHIVDADRSGRLRRRRRKAKDGAAGLPEGPSRAPSCSSTSRCPPALPSASPNGSGRRRRSGRSPPAGSSSARWSTGWGGTPPPDGTTSGRSAQRNPGRPGSGEALDLAQRVARPGRPGRPQGRPRQPWRRRTSR
jgi:hypothetical protein